MADFFASKDCRQDYNSYKYYFNKDGDNGREKYINCMAERNRISSHIGIIIVGIFLLIVALAIGSTVSYVICSIIFVCFFIGMYVIGPYFDRIKAENNYDRFLDLAKKENANGEIEWDPTKAQESMNSSELVDIQKENTQNNSSNTTSFLLGMAASNLINQ